MRVEVWVFEDSFEQVGHVWLQLGLVKPDLACKLFLQFEGRGFKQQVDQFVNQSITFFLPGFIFFVGCEDYLNRFFTAEHFQKSSTVNAWPCDLHLWLPVGECDYIFDEVDDSILAGVCVCLIVYTLVSYAVSMSDNSVSDPPKV